VGEFHESMRVFSEACGLKGALCLTVWREDGAERRRVELWQPYAIIGRDPKTEVVLEHVGIGRRHVYLQVLGGQAFWLSLEGQSQKRTGVDPQSMGWLMGGRALRLGPYSIRQEDGSGGEAGVVGARAPRETPLVALQERGDRTRTALEFLNGPSRNTRWPVRRMMSLVGSASGCKFRLTDPSVSRFHASLLCTVGGLWVVDLIGREAVRINGETVRAGRLDDGDILGIGRYEIKVHRQPGSETSSVYPSIRLASLAGLDPESSAPGLAGESGWGRQSLPIPAGRSPSPDEPGLGTTLSPVSPGGGVSATELLPSGNELTVSMLAPLVNQFALMQQQMFDQFHQALAMMVKMFSEMHRDQMDVIRAELAGLRELSQEVRELKAELERRTSGSLACGPLSAGADLSAPPESSQASVAGPGGDPAQTKFQLEATALLEQVAQIWAPDPMISAGGVATGLGEPRSQGEASVAQAHPAAPAADPLTPTAAARQVESGAPSRTRVTPASNLSDREAVAWLHQRIATLQSERESRWQKLRKLLPGLS